MIRRLRAWWNGLAPRERAGTAAALLVVGTALVYSIAVAPAWTARSRLQQELPRLQEQAAQVEALSAEARSLKERGTGFDDPQALRSGAERSLERAGLSGGVAVEGARGLAVNVRGIPAGAWLAWLEAFTRESRLRIVHARIARTTGPGLVDAEAHFEMPGR